MTQPETRGEDTKVCPYCAETIRAAAIKCRYCQSDLTAAGDPAPTPAAPATSPAAAPPPPGGGTERRRSRRRSALAAGRSRRDAAPDQAPDQAPTRRRAPIPRRLWLPVALACLLLVVLALLDWQQRRALEAEARSADVARAAVTDKVEALLSYRHATFDEDVATAQQELTPSFREEYAPTVAEIRRRAVAQRRDQQAEVLAVGVVSADEDRVRTLVFVNTLSATEDSGEPPRVMQNRVIVDLVRAEGGDGWLVDDLSFPSA